MLRSSIRMGYPWRIESRFYVTTWETYAIIIGNEVLLGLLKGQKLEEQGHYRHSLKALGGIHHYLGAAAPPVGKSTHHIYWDIPPDVYNFRPLCPMICERNRLDNEAAGTTVSVWTT